MIDIDKYEGHSEMIDANEIGEIWEYLADTISEDSRGRAEANYNLVADAPDLLAEVERLREIEQEWLMMWATLEELNLVADVRKNMTLHGFVFPTDEDMEGDEEE